MQDKMLLKLDSWEECLNYLQGEYTLSTKNICKLLKCSRNFVSSCIKPYIHHIYISNGFSNKRVNYVRIANMHLGSQLDESVWYNKREFYAYIRDHIVSFSRKTIQVPLEWFIEERSLKSFFSEREQFNLITPESPFKYQEWKTKKTAHLLSHLNLLGQDVFKTLPSPYQRSLTQSVNVECPHVLHMKSWVTLRDLKDYGDIDETIYRQLFEQGAYHIVLSLPNMDGKISKKYYYFVDEDETFSYHYSPEMITLSYSSYQKYRHRFPI